MTAGAVHFTFTQVLKEIQDEKILVPLIRAALLDPKFKGFNVLAEEWRPRPYDGRFHPSSHATWTERMLALYLMNPDAVDVEEKPSLIFVLAVTQGKFWHEFYQRLLKNLGVLEAKEVPIDNPETNVLGHADGRLGGKDSRLKGELLELKTMNDWKHGKITNEDELRELEPGYYGQSQDYLRETGCDRMRYLIISNSSPYDMTEFVVHANPAYQEAQRRRYTNAMAMAEAGDIGDACCALGSKQAKTCPVRSACPIGRMTRENSR